MTKGRVALPLGVMAVTTTSQTLFIPLATWRRQVSLLGMTKEKEVLPGESDGWNYDVFHQRRFFGCCVLALYQGTTLVRP
jgi:hypothetical protein